MTSVVEQLKLKARSRLRRVLLPETQDPRVLEAAIILAQEELAIPVLLERADSEIDFGKSEELSKLESVSVNDEDLLSKCAEQLFENRKHKSLSREAAAQAVSDPVLFAALLVKTGSVDAAVAGSIAATPSVIRAGLYGIGTLPGQKMVSSFFLMQLPDRAITYSDCGVVPDPNANELAEIAISAAASHKRLAGEEPRVALLSFSTLGSADHPRVRKVRDALAIIEEKAPELCVDGELQFDAAFVPEVAKRKAPDSPVAGKANVFVFPDLDSGNIAYKITERLGGAKALGPLIQGLDKPLMDLSRGCSVNDIVEVSVIASVLS